ncbi:MAG: hypothetical protein KUG68_02355 [Flavobacteriaceae bacterium]|nr:hypothetical protein [Flavobacteriaceae bacterium]
MYLFRKNYLVLFLLFPILMIGQAESIFNGIQLNDSEASVTKKLKEISENTKTVTVNNPIFPLAETTESHLLCNTVITQNGTIENVIFTFADDKLCYIEARGNVVKPFTAHRKDTARNYMDYEVYVQDKLFVTKKEDVIRITTKEAMHTNLFTWSNPYMDSNYKAERKPNSTNEIPSFLKMGETLEDLRTTLEANSLFTSEEKLDGSDPNAQFQLNCFGVDYLGFPRKIEARFGDGILNVVWILTAKGEEDRIRKALKKQYGEPIFVDETWEVFNNWQVALRKDKPEVLLMEQQIGLGYKTNYFKQ